MVELLISLIINIGLVIALLFVLYIATLILLAMTSVVISKYDDIKESRR